MKYKELILLLVALTKGGKTTIARTLCKKECRGVMSKLCNCRTEISVDWTYILDADSISLIDVLLNYKGIFGTDIKENIDCQKFNEILNGKDGEYLKNIFKLEEQFKCSSNELEEYVKDKIKKYINDCNIDNLSELIKNRKSNRFIRRIKVIIPPEESFSEYLKKNDISLVMRDTRGMLDMDVEEVKEIPLRTMQELGIDGIDAVLLMGTSAPFADTLSWYKTAYKSAFESVPVFIMARQDAVSVLFDCRYGIDENNINVTNIKEFLKAAKRGTEKGFKEFLDSFYPCYQLLEMFEIGRFIKNKFEYTYKVYDNEDLRYVYPNSSSLQQCTSLEPNYDALDYKLYEIIVHENIKDMISKMIEHNEFKKAVLEDGQINSDFINEVTNDMHVYMCPNYQNYTRYEVCENILNGEILGPRNGIVTMTDGKVKYLGAVTSAVSAREWLKSKAYSYKYKGSIRNSNGTELIKNMSKEFQANLIRMFILKNIEDNTDCYACFRNNYFIDRYKVREAILAVRNNTQHIDALTETTKEILKLIFKKRQ